MKRILLVLSAAGLIATVGCKKDDTTPTPEQPQAALVIGKGDFSNNYKPAGANYTNATINTAGTPVTVPAAGENQTWDVSGLAISSTAIRGGYTLPANAAFPSSTFAYATNHKFGFGALQSTGTASTEFYDVADNGYFYQGTATLATDVITVPSIGGTLTYAPQNLVLSTKMPEINFPASYNSTAITANIVNNANFIANAPAVGVNNTPGQARTTDSVNNRIIASGTITLKNIGKKRVLVNRHSITEKTNFFLGGAPAPTALLNMLGLTDGTITGVVYYDFYAEGLGRVGSISCNADGTTVTGAYFRVL